MVKFDCDFTGSTEFLYTWATGQIEDNGSLEVLATKEPRTVNDDPFRTGESQSQPSGQYGIEGSQPIGEPTATASPGSDLDNENDLEDSDESKESGSSLSAGTIAGSVVGGVLGVSGFAAAGFMFFLMKKRKRQDNGSLEDVVPDDGTSISTDGSPSTQAVHHSKNLSGPGTVTTDTSGDYESKYNISEVAGSEVPSSPAYEIDGRQYMAELPAHEPRREGA